MALGIRRPGPRIDASRRDRIFEYGVSDAEPQPCGARRGQGPSAARTGLSKMDGTLQARNLPDGVVFDLGLRIVGAAQGPSGPKLQRNCHANECSLRIDRAAA